VDEITRCLQGILHKLRVRRRNEIKEIVMAKVIEFYIPTRFRRPVSGIPQVQFGKIVKFGLPTKKSA
jgi:hypothetical protein